MSTEIKTPPTAAEADPGLWEVVVRHLLEHCDEPPDAAALTPATSLREELGLGSLQAIEMVMDLEDELEITIEDDELAGLTTLGDVLRLAAVKLRGGAGPETKPGPEPGLDPSPVPG